MKRETWTIEPDADVNSLMKKAINERAASKSSKRGWRTVIINEALRTHLNHLRGKREGNLS